MKIAIFLFNFYVVVKYDFSHTFKDALFEWEQCELGKKSWMWTCKNGNKS